MKQKLNFYLNFVSNHICGWQWSIISHLPYFVRVACSVSLQISVVVLKAFTEPWIQIYSSLTCLSRSLTHPLQCLQWLQETSHTLPCKPHMVPSFKVSLYYLNYLVCKLWFLSLIDETADHRMWMHELVKPCILSLVKETLSKGEKKVATCGEWGDFKCFLNIGLFSTVTLQWILAIFVSVWKS